MGSMRRVSCGGRPPTPPRSDPVAAVLGGHISPQQQRLVLRSEAANGSTMRKGPRWGSRALSGLCSGAVGGPTPPAYATPRRREGRLRIPPYPNREGQPRSAQKAVL